MNSIVTIFLFGIIGWIASIIINYLSDVLPVQRRLGRPVCRSCGQPFSTLRYLWFLFPCQKCGRFRTLRTIVVNLLCVGGFIWLGIDSPERLGTAAGMFWFMYLLLIIVIDVEHRLILHWVTGVGSIAALITGWMIHGLTPTLFGGVIGLLVMLCLYGLGVGYARWSSRKRGVLIAEGEALGFGDVTLSGVVGLLLGWPGIVAGLVLAICLAGVAAIVAILPMVFRRKYDANLALPYGPFLALGTFYLLFLS